MVQHPLAILLTYRPQDASPQAKFREPTGCNGGSTSHFFVEFFGEGFLAWKGPGFETAHYQVEKEVTCNQHIQWGPPGHNTPSAEASSNGHSCWVRALHKQAKTPKAIKTSPQR